jgi:hypothetical protein
MDILCRSIIFVTRFFSQTILPLPIGSCTHVKTHKLLQVCKQVVTNLFTSCRQVVFALLVPSCCNSSLKQALTASNKLARWHYQTCDKVVLTGVIQSWYNKNVTRLTTQGCNNIVISWLYRTRWNNLATSVIISTSLLQVVNSLFQTCWQFGTSSANTTCWQTCYKTCDFYACRWMQYEKRPISELFI